MREHVLVVGSGRDLPARVRRARPGTETSVICRLEFVAKLRELTEHTRVIAVRDDAPDEEWVALAVAAHELHPFSRIATFGETDQDRCAVIGEALGIATHSPRTVELVHDKQAMRARLRETGVDTTASAVVADLADLTAFVDEHGFPCVVKPVPAPEVPALRWSGTRAHSRRPSSEPAADSKDCLTRGCWSSSSMKAPSSAWRRSLSAVSTRSSRSPASSPIRRTSSSSGMWPPRISHPRIKKRSSISWTGCSTPLGVEFGATHTEIVLGDDWSKGDRNPHQDGRGRDPGPGLRCHRCRPRRLRRAADRGREGTSRDPRGTGQESALPLLGDLVCRRTGRGVAHRCQRSSRRSSDRGGQ